MCEDRDTAALSTEPSKRQAPNRDLLGGTLMIRADCVIDHGQMVIANSILVENVDASSQPDDLRGEAIGLGTNLINPAQVEFVTNFANRIEPSEALLGSLHPNGGTTPMHALLPGSPAVDQATQNVSIDQIPLEIAMLATVDQRGQIRDIAPDLGAHEYVMPEFPTAKITVDTSSGVDDDKSAAVSG